MTTSTKKAIIIEDNGRHYSFLKQGIENSKINFEIIQLNLNKLINSIKKKKPLEIPQNIDLFIIDVSLEKGRDEIGLAVLSNLFENYKTSFKYLIVSIWELDEFETTIQIDESSFINKNNYQGFELKIETRNKINRLW